MRGYSPNYGHYVAYARPPGRVYCAVPSDKDRQVALRRPMAARDQARRISGYRLSFFTGSLWRAARPGHPNWGA
jgi:hypothetical protein